MALSKENLLTPLLSMRGFKVSNFLKYLRMPGINFEEKKKL